MGALYATGRHRAFRRYGREWSVATQTCCCLGCPLCCLGPVLVERGGGKRVVALPADRAYADQGLAWLCAATWTCGVADCWAERATPADRRRLLDFLATGHYTYGRLDTPPARTRPRSPAAPWPEDWPTWPWPRRGLGADGPARPCRPRRQSWP